MTDETATPDEMRKNAIQFGVWALSDPAFANSFIHEGDPFFLPPGHTATTPVETFAIDRAIIRVSELLEPYGAHLAFQGDPMNSGQVRLWAASLPNQMGAVMDRDLKLAVIGLTEFINERAPTEQSMNAMKTLAVI